jgi:hypothetical protein
MFKKIYFILALVLIIQLQACSIIKPDTTQSGIAGRGPYALLDPKFNCSAFTSSVQGVTSYSMSVLWLTFGTDTTCLQSLLNTNAISLFELHLINGPCIRDKRCGTYEPFYGYTIKSLEDAVKKKDATVQAIFQNTAQQASQAILPLLPSTTACYINPVLETNLSRESSVTVQEWVRPYFNNRCKFVWNPVGPNPGAPIEGASVSEGHGLTPTFVDNNCIANTDGQMYSTVSDWKAYFAKYSNCVAAMAWTFNDNCMVPNQGFVDPRQRTCADTSEFIAAGQALLNGDRE